MDRNRKCGPGKPDAIIQQLESRRLLAFGAADATFGVGGRVQTAFSGSFNVNAQQLVVEDDKILAAGNTGLARYSEDGQVDSTFGTDGKVVFSGLTFKAATTDPNGKIYILVTASSGTVVLRYNANGATDSGFANNGTALVTNNTNFSAGAIAIQSDGKLLIAGTTRTDSGNGAKVRVYRLKTDGAGDSTFDGDGLVEFSFAASTFLSPIVRDKVVSVAQLSNGKILVLGGGVNWAPSFTDSDTGQFVSAVYDKAVFAAARLNSNGSLDGAYGSSGVTRSEYASGAKIANAGISAILPSAAAIDDDGHAYVGAPDNAYNLSSPVVAKFSDDDGAVSWQTSPGSGSVMYRPTDLAVLEDGRVAVVGQPRADQTSNGIPFVIISTSGEFQNVVLTFDEDDSTPEFDPYYSTNPAIAQAEDGELLIAGAGGIGYGGDSYIVGKFDSGSAAAARPDEFLNARANDIARDSAGGLHLAYYDAALRVLKYAYRAPNGVWNDAIAIDNQPNAGQYVSIDVSSKTLPGIAYFDGTNGDAKLVTFNGKKWIYYSVESKGSVGLYPSLQFDNSDRPTMTYYKKTGGDLRFAVMKEPGIFGYETVDTTDDVGRTNVLLASPKSGRYTVAYANTTTGEVKWARHEKGGKWSIKVAADTEIGADFISMAYGFNYEPAITYYDANKGDLKVAYFTANTGTFTVKALATSGAQGLYSQAYFPSYYSQPAVFHYNRSQDKIVLLKNIIDSTPTVATTIEGHGRYLSMAIDKGSGVPTDIAYFDADANVIQVRPAPREKF